MYNSSLKIAAAFLCLLIASCGGGGGGGSTPSDTKLTDSGNSTAGSGSKTPQGSTGGGNSNIGGTPTGTTDQSPSIDTLRWNVESVFNGDDPGVPDLTVEGVLAGRTYMDMNNEGQALVIFTIDPDPAIPNNELYPSFIMIPGARVPALSGAMFEFEIPLASTDFGKVLGMGYRREIVDGNLHRADLVHFIHENGRYTPVPDGSTYINNKGSTAGNITRNVAPQRYFPQAFVYINGVRTEVPLREGHNWNRVEAINNMDIAVGAFHAGSPDVYQEGRGLRAFIFDKGELKDLGVLPGYVSSVAKDINDKGVVVGYNFNGSYFAGSDDSRPFIYRNGVMTEIPIPTGYYGRPAEINERGQVVGFMKELGSPGTGQPFLYTGGKVTNLNTLPEVVAGGWNIWAVEKINDSGQILGWAYKDGVNHCIRLTPVQ